MKQAHIDHGRSFDWGKAAGAYAEYRDIYPPAFYEHLLARGVVHLDQMRVQRSLQGHQANNRSRQAYLSAL